MTKRIAFAAAALALAVPSFAQMTGDRGQAKVSLDGKTVSIDYGRPSLKGRDMLGQAVVGEAWRMGSNAPTTLKTDADLAFGTATVPKGEYVLKATTLDADKWQLNVLAKLDQAKVADAPLVTKALPESVEQFTIDLSGAGKQGTLRLSWGKTALETTFTAK